MGEHPFLDKAVEHPFSDEVTGNLVFEVAREHPSSEKTAERPSFEKMTENPCSEKAVAVHSSFEEVTEHPPLEEVAVVEKPSFEAAAVRPFLVAVAGAALVPSTGKAVSMREVEIPGVGGLQASCAGQRAAPSEGRNAAVESRCRDGWGSSLQGGR
mmetsp:Transcript_15835/g.28121  ORF Transcript_15835/g.28121 Transcript_15835/m.28121 type:complete len:156 (-) Transcript_15835:343-810(-)